MSLNVKKLLKVTNENIAKTWRTLLASHLTEKEFAQIEVKVSENGVTLEAPSELIGRAEKIVGLK